MKVRSIIRGLIPKMDVTY